MSPIEEDEEQKTDPESPTAKMRSQAATRVASRSMLQAVAATPGAWVDASTRLTTAVIRAVKAAGKVGIFRYVPLPGESNRLSALTRDVSAGELEDICGAGLDCCLVQHVRTGSNSLWVPSQHSSSDDANCAADWADAVGYPAAHIFEDLEAVNDTRIATITYAVGWQRQMIERGRPAGLYHGYSVPLSAADLYELPGFDCYWTDAGNRPVGTRGNAVSQGSTLAIAEVEFDEDEVRADALGGLPIVARAA